MNIINKLTIRHLKANNRRTLVTIIGVIISVAMITAVATLGVSFLNLMIRQEIANNGEWHVKYKDINRQQLKSIKKDRDTEKLILTNDLGYAALEGSENDSKPFLFLKEYSAAGLKQFPIELKEGRLPAADNEVVISEEIEETAHVKYSIGDSFTLNIGERWLPGGDKPLSQTDPLQKDENGLIEKLTIQSTESFKIVGVIKRPKWEPTWSPGYTVIEFIDENSLSASDTFDAVVVVKKVRGSLYQDSKALASQSGIKTIQYNNELLRYYGVTNNDNLRMTLFSLAAIIMGVIIVGSVALIYNAFAISVSERARHLGMLSSVGATKKQKRNSVFFEGAVIGAISIPFGMISGLVGIGVTFSFINSFIEGALGGTEKLKLIITPASLLVACVISIATIFISTYLPARKASKVTAIDAIRQSDDIKLSGKAVKTSKLVRKLFGIEAEIGLKNLKRNKRRYLATVFSLVISIVLFLSVSFFTESLKKSIELSQEDIAYDIHVDGGQMEKEDLQPFTKLDYVTASSMVQELHFLNTWVEEKQLPNELQKQVEQEPSILEDGKYPYSVSLYGLDKKSFENFAVKLGVDHKKLENRDLPAAILVDRITYQDYESGKFIETKSIDTKIGAVLDLYRIVDENGKQEIISQVEVGALTAEVPIGVHTSGPGAIDIIVSEEGWNALLAGMDPKIGEVGTYLYLNSSDPMATQAELDQVKPSNLYVYNVYQSRQEQEQQVMFMSVFTYGFIVLISLVSIANIFNTISTSISLRKREFAMLRSIGM
ncbi:FtsX-like permease family protein, partial [Neobacillus vireti]|uniref:FtsX-like permease family protein n=1 Tax=Neobacillus vireti TaxID=220686 RepID=UPI0030007E05